MQSVLTYPLDIIKTNRILQTSLSRDGAESIPREFTALYEKGGLSRGLFRGLLVALLAAKVQSGEVDAKAGVSFIPIALTAACNPFSILQVHKQVFHNNQTKTYSQILNTVGVSRLFTLGLIPSLVRNFVLCAGFYPSFFDRAYSPTSLLFAVGGVWLSHPFEVARVILQHNGSSNGLFGNSRKVLRGLYNQEGVAGLYRGVVPRTIHLVPTILTVSALQTVTQPNFE